MITTKMVLEAKKRLKMLMEKPMYRKRMNCFSGKVRKNTKAALLAKLLNDMEGEQKYRDSIARCRAGCDGNCENYHGGINIANNTRC